MPNIGRYRRMIFQQSVEKDALFSRFSCQQFLMERFSFLRILILRFDYRLNLLEIRCLKIVENADSLGQGKSLFTVDDSYPACYAGIFFILTMETMIFLRNLLAFGTIFFPKKEFQQKTSYSKKVGSEQNAA